jgi:hypothetical protein
MLQVMKSSSFLHFRNVIITLMLSGLIQVSCTQIKPEESSEDMKYPVDFTISKDDLLDKIKGGWAGQVIGCTYGGPTEFKFNGTMIQDYIPIEWDENRMEWWYINGPGLYDDIYMDLTFVEVFEKEGIGAPASSHANAFAHAEYQLWHANQAARYNILQGIPPPASGYWENNPHADDIDFQIEADFAGLMNPGMVNSSSEICDRVGHIMNYGDGWYGGVYVAAMYSLSFYSEDIEFIVNEALKTIPEESEFYKCIFDIIQTYHQYPDNWKRAWFEAEQNWSSDIGCPAGVFQPMNIDAKINAAYIVIGLLYGGGDFGKTVDISTRCGQDSDCNPASVGGIIGTVIGYDRIPAHWKQGLDKVEDMDFKYTTISLNDAYGMSFRHAQEMVISNGGKIEGEKLIIPLEDPLPVKYEKAFEGHTPTRVIDHGWNGIKLDPVQQREYSLNLDGKGYVIKGFSRKEDATLKDLDLLLDVFIDGELYEQAVLPIGGLGRRFDLTWKYNLPDGHHEVRLKWANPTSGYHIIIGDIIIYGPA